MKNYAQRVYYSRKREMRFFAREWAKLYDDEGVPPGSGLAIKIQSVAHLSYCLYRLRQIGVSSIGLAGEPTNEFQLLVYPKSNEIASFQPFTGLIELYRKVNA